MDNRLHNDCDGGQCWACAQDKADRLAKYAAAEINNSHRYLIRAEVAETELQRCREERATLLEALIDVWRKNSIAAANGYRDHSLLEALFLTNQATSAAIKNSVSEERHQELCEEISKATERHVD